MANTKIVEGEKPYTGGTAIEVDNINKIISLLLRSEDNLLHVNGDNELYCDLQIANGITPTDDFEVGVTTGIVNANDGRPQNGLLLHYETTSGAYAQWLYAQDGYFYLDGGTGVFKKVYYAQDVDDAIQALADSLATVAFTGDYNDLINKPTIGNAVLTIQKNGTTIDTFTANATVDKTINVTVPTALSDLTNDVVNDGKLTIKKNNNTIAEFTANDATNVYANIDVPLVINNTTTIDSANSLSAAMGKELQDQINNINSIGRFLSLWNCTTGLPQTDPTVSPYTYHTGDYYVVGAVSTGTNYKPDGGSYTIGVASTTVETATVAVGDMYFYDGNTWSLKPFTGQTMPIDNVLSTTSTNAVENRVVTNALNDKADLVSSAVSGDLAGLDANGNITDSGIAPSDIVKTSGDQTIAGTKTFSTSPVVPNKTADATNTGTAIATEAQVYKKQDTLTAGANITIDSMTNKISADVNTKTFHLNSLSLTSVGQEIMDYYWNGGYPIIAYNGNDQIYTLEGAGATGATFSFTDVEPLILGQTSDTPVIQYQIHISYTGTTVTGITYNTKEIRFLSTGYNYPTPYSPIYDGSPATKKYVDDKKSSISVTLAAANWSSKTITVTATGVTASNTVIISPDPSSITDYADSSVYCSSQSTDSLTFTCDTVPSNDLTVNVVILN